MPETHCIHCDLQPQPCRSRFAKILEQCASGVIVIDAKGVVRFVNDAAEKFLGRPVTDLLGTSGDFLFPEGGELIFHRQDGSAVAAEIRMVETEWGDETAQLAFLRDVTDRKRTEDALKAAISKLEEEKAKSEAIIAAIGDGISIQDTSFKIIYQNQIHKDIMGDHGGEQCYQAYAHRDAVCGDCYMVGSFLDGSIHTVERKCTVGQQTMHFEITVSPLKDPEGKVIAGIEVVRDITERKQTEERLRFMSSHDILTGLYNRFYFEQELLKLERGRRFPMSIVMADVDDLKAINDTLGHVAGDQQLKQAALLLGEAFRGDDVVARIGGDEFAVLLPDTGKEEVQEVVARIRESQGLWNDSHGAPLNLSLGIATAENGSQLLEALKAADQNMYQDKLSRTGRPPRRPCKS
jgi:diguanylate cyclase (GGDEF)-like protein